MVRRVAVEEQLSPVKAYLQNNGFEVVPLGSDSQVDAVVVSGQNENILGISDVTIPVPVINAEGLSPEEVYQQVKNRSKP